MNILHMTYAVEVARAGSVNKAAEKLRVAQPNLSRSIRELENDLGIKLFSRSSRGMSLTPDGESFIEHAKKILAQIDEVENFYMNRRAHRQRFSVCVPRAPYISAAFARVCRSCIGREPVDLSIQEATASAAIDHVLSSDCSLGILRYAEKKEKVFARFFNERGLKSRQIRSFRPSLLIHRESGLARLEHPALADLKPYIELIEDAPGVPSLSFSDQQKEERSELTERRIFIADGISRFDILKNNQEAFIWASPVPADILASCGLVQKDCGDCAQTFQDTLIYRKDYRLTLLDNAFIQELYRPDPTDA